MCIEYDIQLNMYHASTQGVDERMINVHYYYYVIHGHVDQQLTGHVGLHDQPEVKHQDEQVDSFSGKSVSTHRPAAELTGKRAFSA